MNGTRMPLRGEASSATAEQPRVPRDPAELRQIEAPSHRHPRRPVDDGLRITTFEVRLNGKWRVVRLNAMHECRI
jgi:hypothetical protein